MTVTQIRSLQNAEANLLSTRGSFQFGCHCVTYAEGSVVFTNAKGKRDPYVTSSNRIMSATVWQVFLDSLGELSFPGTKSQARCLASVVICRFGWKPIRSMPLHYLANVWRDSA